MEDISSKNSMDMPRPKEKKKEQEAHLLDRVMSIPRILVHMTSDTKESGDGVEKKQAETSSRVCGRDRDHRARVREERAMVEDLRTYQTDANTVIRGCFVFLTEQMFSAEMLARDMGLRYAFVEAPFTHDGSKTSRNGLCLVTGRPIDDVPARVAEVRKEAELMKRTLKVQGLLMRALEREAHEQHEDVLSFAEFGGWDVTGRWVLDVPKQMAGPAGEERLATMTVYMASSARGLVHVWAVFDLAGQLTGTLRLINPRLRGMIPAPGVPSATRELNDHDEHGFQQSMGTHWSHYRIPAECTPSQTCPTFQFHWRATTSTTENGNGRPIVAEDGCSDITFFEPGGVECQGRFVAPPHMGGLVIPSLFRGRKVGGHLGGDDYDDDGRRRQRQEQGDRELLEGLRGSWEDMGRWRGEGY